MSVYVKDVADGAVNLAGAADELQGHPLRPDGFFTTTPLVMTGLGSVVEADVSPLNSTGDGFTSFLEPER